MQNFRAYIFAKANTPPHPAAGSLCDSWATCYTWFCRQKWALHTKQNELRTWPYLQFLYRWRFRGEAEKKNRWLFASKPRLGILVISVWWNGWKCSACSVCQTSESTTLLRRIRTQGGRWPSTTPRHLSRSGPSLIPMEYPAADIGCWWT